MTISSLTGQSYATQVTAQRLAALKSQFDGLSTQLATGKVSQTYGGLGTGRITALSAQARISSLEGYATGIASAQTKLKLASASLTQVQTTASTVSSTLNASATAKTQTGLTSQQTNARQQFAAVLDALNQTTGDTYVFGGRATTTEPVLGADVILNGDKATGRAGLATLIAERKAADGVAGTGNLTVGGTGTSVSLSEPADGLTRANFGFVLGSVTSSNATAFASTPTAAVAPTTAVTLAQQPKDGDVVRVTLNQADGSQKVVDYVARTTPTPGSTTEFAIGATAADSTGNLGTLIGTGAVAAVQSGNPSPRAALSVTSQGTAGSVALTVGTPANGDTVTVNLKLRDGTTTSLTLTAKSTPDASDPTQFAIGASAADTATNLRAALTGALQTSAGSTLASSSATLAAKDMFAGSTAAGLSPRRIETTGTGYAFSADPTGKTVIWYNGDDAPGDARSTASVQVSDGYSVAYGARANESAIQSALAGLATLASESFTVGTSGALSTSDLTRYNAMASRVTNLLAPSDGGQTLTQLGTELSLADASITNAKTQNTATQSVLENTVSSITDASTETVATQLLALQTQLQASYQVTSMISKLSLVNYL